ncbi:AAA family ATPase [Patescibacteria group bacterium]|nr:AAA family ATPase [Patescibacteria group bacterium]MBU1900852.1 AAA family ATPase [Patescibacteria group bacterium]
MKKNKITQKILITGMPYSGKSYVSHFLEKQGENVVDADNMKGLGQWFDKNGNKVNFFEGASKEWLDSHDFLWDKNFLYSWIEQQKSTVYLFGLSANILDVVDLFDKAYYLDISPDLLKERFSNNERTNLMGQTEEQQEAILRDLSEFAKKAKGKGLIFVQADQSPEDIYKIITN